MSIRTIVAMSLVGALTLSAYGQWDVEYDGSVNPWSASPAWTGTGSGFQSAVTSVADPYYPIDTLADPADTQYFTIVGGTNWDVDFSSTGLIFEAKVKVLPNSENGLGHSIVLADGSNLVSMAFRNDGIGGVQRVRMNNSIWGPSNITNMGDFLTYRLELDAAGWDLLIDGSPYMSGTYIGTTDDLVRWGDPTQGAGLEAHYSTIRWVPEPSALAMLAAGGLMLLRRRR
jgi:hypothetical protein